MRQYLSLLRFRLSVTPSNPYICERTAHINKLNHQRQTFTSCAPLCRFKPAPQKSDLAMSTSTTKTGQPFDRANFESLMTRRFFYKLSYRYGASFLPLSVFQADGR